MYDLHKKAFFTATGLVYVNNFYIQDIKAFKKKY